ncbi:microtubule-associated protein futsch [Lasius niger]|uniref:Microtubule-associated protein futsch n=1 Tax=Lasius niger TaxID=67767 RepID=A0A0J7L3P1_LASNI|nr:microtubule-associated protein futsch [Lasius niger]
MSLEYLKLHLILKSSFLSWDKDSCHVDLEKELLALVAQAPEGEEARNGERLIQYATENLVTEVLIHPQTNTLLQCIRNLLASFTKHRHIIHAGYTYGGNGSWILQDGTFSLADFLDAFSEHEVQRVLRAYENSVTVDIHCAGVGDWTTSRLSKEACCRFCRVRVNPDDVLTAGVPAITSFTNYIGQYLVPQTLDQLMEPSDVVGNIRFSHPTLYVFPGGQGDAALFGINGFNMLVDGGFARKACFWDFTRHLDRLDAVLVTRINNSNIGGMFSVLRKKKELHVYPQIGHFFCNLVERRQSNSPDGDKDIDPLILNLTDIGQEMVLNLRHINLRAHPCYRDSEPINLYHKVGHGTLDMYVLSPSKDSREVREFLSKWHASDSKLFAGSHKKDSNNLTFPIQNLVSICALLVWQPANPEDNITRILFPGSTPQHKIFEGFERLKHLDFLKHPVCSAKTLSPSTSLATLRDKPIKKFGLIEKESKKISEPKKREPSEPKSIKTADEAISKTTPQSTPIIPTSKSKTEMKTKKVAENKKIETEAKESKKIEKELKEIKRESKKELIKVDKLEKREDEIKKADLIKPESDKTASKEIKEPKIKPEPKKKETKESKTAIKAEPRKTEVTPKPKLSEKKTRLSGAEKKDAVKSSPTTPKKTLNGTATRTEMSKAVPKTRPAPKVIPSLPAKSAKEANNRKVVEQKKSEVEKSAVKDTAAPVVKMSAKPKPTDRKPISRRTKPVSPSKARMPGSPAKSTRSTPTTSVKSDKDGVIRKVKGDRGTTDSSTVSTPSGIEPEAVKPIDKSLIEQSEDMSLDSIESKVLADLKEEREVVEEIEAVLQKAERIEETRKDDRFEGDDEITAEATDKKEEDITEEDVTAEIEDMPKKEGSRKESQELTEEDEYLIVEKEEVYTEDSAQSGEGEQKHVLDEAESEKAKILQDAEAIREKGEKEEPEEKGKDESPEKKIDEIANKDQKEVAGLSSEYKEQLQKEVKEIIASAAEIVQKTEEKDDSAKKDSEDITKEPSSLSPEKLDSSEKKTTDTDIKPDVDQKEHILEKMEESQERISTIESGATTTAPTLPEDERIPLDEIKEDIDEKHVIEEVKEKDAPAKQREEVVPETVPATAKPEVKVFDVRQAMQNLQRDIVKTPDEVADLPVHEEVDPKLYRMEDFEKGKEEKPSPTTQEIKDLPTPPVKEQKGVFSFFGKVADKFEKGIDKLTKKSKKESDKDSDEKSSSKSSSPKEAKVQEKTLFEEVDVEKMFPKVGKPADKPEMFEKMKPTIVDVKVAAIKETASFIQEEILDAQKKSVSDIEEKLPTDKLEEIKKAETEIEEALLAKDVSSKPIDDQDIAKEIELLKEEDIGEDAEEVKALLEEASKKFKTVKDSLRDSLESLEEKVKEEEIGEVQHDILKDTVKYTLEGVAEKLEEMKPHIKSHSLDTKEPEKVKFDIPKDEEFEEEYEEEPEGPYRDVKEAVRDVGEVLAGTAGIILEDKPKDVIEIVKKVAEVLKEDDFLSDKLLFDQASKKEEILSIPDRKPSKEEISSISTERKPSVPSEKISPEKDTKLEESESKLTHEDVITPTKVGITEVFPVHEEVEELIEKPGKLLAPCEKPGTLEVKEEPCVKMIKIKDDILTSPVKDTTKDKKDAQKICAEMLKDDQHICDQHKKPADDDTCRVDVMQAGIESICVKEMAKRPSLDDKLEESDIEHPVISFEQKVSPAKAEIVMVTPGSTPTSPKFTADKMYDRELEIGLQELSKLPEDIKQILSKEAPVEEVIEELIITKKKKITIEVIEYITVVKRIPRERVIYIIEEIIVKKGLPRESVVDDPEILKLKESITPEKRMEVEDYIVNEYIVKEKRITIDIVEEISIKKVVPKKIVIEIIEEIIVRRKIARHMVLDIPEEVLSEIIKEKSPEESPEESAEEQITPKIDITAKRESIAEVSSAPTKEEEPIVPRKREEIEEFVVNEYVIKGNKITASIIDEISAKKDVPKKILIEIIEEIIIKKKIPRNVLLDVPEEDLLEISAIHKTTPEDKEEKKISETEALNEKQKSIIEIPSTEIPETKEPVTPQERTEVEEYIVKEYITKGDSINIQKLEEICGKMKLPKRIIIEIIEEIISKRKMPRHTVLGVTEEELSRIIKEEETPEPEVLAEKRKSVAEVLSPDEKKKTPVELEKDKKEDVPEHEISEEELSPFEEEDVEEEEEEVDGFVSIPRKSFDEMKKAISPIKTEVSPVAAKEHEKDVIDDFEAVEQEYKVRDVPITSPEKADEMKEKEDIEETAEDTMSEVIEADEKFVQETKEKVGKEEPRIDVAKDIKPDDKKREPEEPETSEISEIVDTTEKYLDEAKEKTDDVSPKEKSLTEKADELKEFKEKEMPIDVPDKRSSIDVATAVPEVISKSIAPSTKLIDEKAATDEAKEIEPAIKEKVEDLITKDDKSKPTTPIKDETLKDIVPSTEKLLEKDVKEVEPETKLADAGFAQETKTELLEDDKKSKSLETTEIKETPITKDEKSPQELPEEALSKKLSISKEPEDKVLKAKDEPHVEDVTKPLEKIKDEKLPEDKLVKEEEDIGTVKRMLVTACSEDGREEIEICPTGSITFMKIVTPDDSLKDVSVKSTPDKDSLLLDKDSLHSGVSTPEKDSISEKSVPEGKDKITPEDSLEKSPIGTRDSQDLEDSLEKIELHKELPKDVKIPSIDDDKPKVPEKSENITKPKSPMEKEDLKMPDKIAEKDALQSPEKREEPKSLAKDAGEIEKVKSPAEEIIEKIPKSPTKDIEKVEKSKSPSPSAEKSPIELAEKTTLPIEKALSQPEKEGTAGVSKTPESLRSEDVSPAETIFSKSPTDKPEMYFAKIPISEEEIAPETVTEKLSESVKEIKPIVDKELAMSKEKTPSPESKERISVELETKESDLKPISPVIATSALDEKTPFEKSRSSSISSEKHEEKDVLSTSSEKSEDKESSIRSKSPSIVSDKGEKEGAIDKSRLSSIVSEPVDKKISEAEEKTEEKEQVDKSPSIASEKSEQDIKSPDKLFSVLSDKAEEKETDKPKSPSAIEKETISEKSPILESEYFDEKGPIDEARSSSAISDRSDERKEAERSKSPSIAADKPDLQDVMESYLEKQKSPIFDRPESPKDIDKTEEQDKNRSPSVASDKSDKKVSSRSPSISVEKIDLKDMDLSIERARSPSVVSDKDDKLEQLPVSKSLIDKTEIPKDAQKSPKLDETGLKDIMQPPLDKSRSSSVTSTISESKESVLKEKSPTGEFIEKSKSPSPVEQKLDIGEKEPSEKSRSSSIVGEQSVPEEIKKSPSPVGEKLEDLLQEPIEKSRSPSVSSIVTDKKELADRSKSPSIIDEKPDLKDVAEQPHDKSRSPSVISITGEQKEPIDLSKSPSIAGEKSDSKDVIDIPFDKSRSSSIASVTDAHKEPADRSKSPSIAAEKPDVKDVTETVTDKSRSPSVISVAEEQKEPLDRSKSPSVIDEKPDLKDVVEQLDGKSKSPSATSDLKEPEERSKSPSIAEDKSDEKEPTADKSRSASVVSITSEQKETIDRSKSPSVADEKPDLKDVAEQHIEKLSSDKSDDKKSLGDSKSSSIAGDKSDLTDIAEHPMDKSKSPSIASITSEQKEPTEREKSFSDKKEDFDRSKSPSVASEKSEEAKSVVGSKPSSIAGDTMDLKDVSEPPIDKSRSPSVISVTTDQKEPIEEPVSPQQIKEPHDRSKSPSVASEKSGSRTTSITEDKPDFKDIMEPPADKSRSSSVASLTTEKAEPSGKSISPTVSDKLEPPVDRSKSPSTASDKSDEKVSSDSKVGSKDYYEDATDKSPNLIDAKPSTILEKLDIKSDDVIPDDKAQSSSVVLDKLPIEKIDIDGLKTSSVTDEQDLIDKARSLSIISDKTEPKSSSDVSKSPSLADDKISPSLDIGKIPKDESAKSSRASSPLDKTPKDRSQSVFDIGDTIPASGSRTASLFDDKLPEKVLPQDADFKHIDTEKLLDEKDENKGLPEEKKSPATSPEMIQKEMRKIREKRFADFGEPDTTQPSTIEKSDDEEENIVKVTAEKKAEIEKYILEEFIARKKKITLIVIEKLVMTYSVPQFVVMEIIEDIISRENVPRSAVFDFVDDESSESQYEKEMALLPPQKKADVEKYINEEFIAKKKKITPETLDEIVILKGLPRNIIITIIEEIIVTKRIPRNTVIEGDLGELREKSPDIIEKEDRPIVPTDINLKRASITQDREKPSDTTRSESPDGKISSADSARDAKALSASPSLSPEPIPSDRSTQDSPARSEPHIDEEISISEEKRTEIEKLLEEEYIKKGRRITEVILEEIIIRTSLPKYIILEIVEEIILKRKIPRESVIDVEIYQEEEPEEDYDKAIYRYDTMTDAGYELPHETARKSSVEYRMSGMYSESGERQLDKSDYPMDYESQFHKAFVGGMTEMRTTHITTLSGKSTPEFATHDATPESGIETADKAPDKLSESTTLTTTHITDVEDPKTVQPVQTVTILRESKITEPHLPAESPEKHDAKHEIIGKDESEKHDAKHEIIGKDESEKETAEISKEDQSSDVIKKIVKREVFEQEEPATESDSDVIVVKKIIKREIVEPQEESESVEVKETKRPSVQQDEPEAITKIIKREIVEHDEPEVVTKVIKREIIEQDEPEIITKVIKREIVVPDEGTSDSTQDSGEYVKTITTKTTRTIVTEELPDAELSQTDPSKIYTDPTSGTTYRVVSDESAPDATTSADVKRIVTTVTTITGPDGKVTTKKDVKESTDTVDSEKLLEKLIDSGKIATETTKSAEEIIKETITTVTSGTSTPDAKTLYDSGKSTPDLKQEDKFEAKERLDADKFEHLVSPLVRDLISDDKSYSGKSSPDISLPKDIVFSGSTGKSTPEIPMSPLIRDGAAQPHLSGRSTPDRRSDGRSSTGTPEGFRSGEMIRTTITTTKMISDEGEFVTTTREVTETTNEKGETFVLAEKTDVKVDERLPSKDATESAISSTIGGIKSTESPQHSDSLASDEPPSSPLSSTSQVGYSPETARRYEPSSDKEGEQKEQQIEFSAAAMSSSFYGELPAVPAQISAMKTFHGETGVPKSSDHFMVEKEFAGGYSEKPDAKRYVDEADLDFDKALMEHKEMKEANGAFSSGVAPRYTNGSLRHETDDAKDHPSSSFRDDKDDSKGDSKKDPLEGWGTPLGLPSPKPPRKFNLKSPAQASCSSESTSDTLNFDVLKNWGEPLRLPSPAPATNEVSNKGTPGTPKKERKQAKKVQSENIKNKKRSESPEVTMIPTYDTDTLGYWVADNEEALAANHIDLSPSASRCTINLQDHETSCSAYRLEF